MTEPKGITRERLGGVGLYISEKHRFGTDAFLLADFAAPRHKDTVADLCSGCGIVAAVMYERFRPREMTAVEIDGEGTELFRRTIAESGLENVTAVCADLKEWRAERELDLITCNPPYFAENAGFISPTAANARHELLCSFGDVCRSAKLSLKYGGRLCICNRPERLCDIMTAMRENGIEPKRLRFVAKNPDEAPWLVLAEGKKGGKPFLTVEKTLYTTAPDGSFTDELRACYLSN
ncbi:tRNA1(Val) A37 N6-methylase TrmN6 [Ruminococcus sp. YE71]|uniref:tRNA1(Val) (adenine(37)-N6)-methyltransferase n=1 Tax=unclassified Ruminococcus TaxID=2608920 RepID=UPI000883AF2A|nr:MULTISPECIES: methyltransferase [unclassified Ruminococcus]SDA27160.1 tRNA1(Val) A37 N6-methylase TrmN6 [Ruminococcus sp. YE78]SFW45465.1 tRNA1(Val) A37 N6-methylase TrmN6 [Ruminococcus sp. YE71]